MDNPLVSVIVPLYNKEQWIGRCIDSICAQSYRNLEILIIDDGSTDDSRNVAASIEDERISVISRSNGGVSSARNTGMEHANGEYIAFIDADDRWEPCHIALLVKGFERYVNAAMVSNRLEERKSSEEIYREKHHPDDVLNNRYEYVEGDYLLWLSNNLFLLHIGSSMFKKSILDKNNIRFYEHISLGEDVNFMIHVSQEGQCILSNYIGLIYYRDDENSAMNQRLKEAILTPMYFYGMDQRKWSQGDHRKILKFLRREYLKKAYQNRGLAWKKEELASKLSGEVEIGKVFVLYYLIIRIAPEFIFSLFKKVKSSV